MKKYIFWTAVISVIIAIAAAVAISDEETTENKKNIEFLKSYGWIVDEIPVEQCEIQIPPVMDDIYENYNLLQKEAGLDISPYLGCDAVRYTYILKNFPYPTDSQVRANVITVDKKPVAGDIMTVSINGFMYSLNFNEAVCIAPIHT